ncbi:MAG: hypothetical protein J0I54_12205 [Bosea sp.]|uniref:hypothetical protein n=1 Tax=unclassified Bosea (in: a-proteobacteria) TaxID=2653178 RepID=UPI000A457C2F|nr:MULTISPECIES: hypothetical protein [unclassified Bosea (in: a-proteobacteria)]MBN9457382.1 hypothetical protein [Bosea sp. (in: a-proteobacteria)]
MYTRISSLPQSANRRVCGKTIRRIELHSSSPGAPVALAWRLGRASSGRIAFKCVACEGWHRAPDVVHTSGDVARVTTCPDCFRRSAHKTVNIKIVGEAPGHIARAFSDGAPLWDLAIAFENIREPWHAPLPGQRTIWFRREVFLPRWSDIDIAVQALRNVGFIAEATAIRRMLAPFAKMNAYELSISNRWREVGPTARALVLSSMQNAWEAGGRL